MRPYYAIVKDSFREALRSPMLWILLALVTLLLLMLAPLGARDEMTTQISQLEVQNWEPLVRRMRLESGQLVNSPGKHIWSLLDPALQQRLSNLPSPDRQNMREYQQALEDFRAALNRLLLRRDFYSAAAWRRIDLGSEARALEKNFERLSDQELARFNRIALDRAFADLITESPASSTLLTYFGVVVNPEWFPPIKPELFKQGVRWVVNTFNNWFIGALGIIVAILVTAPIIPRMFEPGQLHLLLSKPVSRSLLLVAQFLGGCAYITILITYLIVGLWLILGWRLHFWETRLLWLIPIYVFAFAMYYTVSTLTAVITRNSVVAVVVSVLFWGACWAVGTGKLELDRRATVSQFHRLVPAGEDLLAINEHNTVFAWNAAKRSWDKVFVSQMQQQLQTVSWLPLPPMPPMPGMVYDPEKQAVIAVERSFEGPMAATLGVGRAADGWKHTSGAAPPIGTFAVLREPQGSVLLAGNLGLFRLRGDPTAPREPVKVLGFELPLLTGAIFESVAEDLVLAPPAAAAIDPQQGRVLVASRAELILLAPDDDKYRVVTRRKLDIRETEPVVVALGGERALVGLQDGRVLVLAADTLQEVSSHRPETRSRPRFSSVAPNGRQFAVTFHNEALWLYDADADRWDRLRVTGQGDISTAAWSPAGELYVADRSTRVTRYDAATWRVVERYSPSLSLLEFSYRYVAVPLYIVFPKPGELYKTFDYLASDRSATEEDKDTVGIASTPANPLLPVWSGFAFIAGMLLITCVYFERQEY